MRLKTLEMQGFKSFPDKTPLNVENGITIVVGPNGCGKSNIADAMKWVLGDTSSKSMRGESMEDVIFAGSEKRSPMNYAQVTVTFDTSEDAGRLKGYEEYDEVSVTRRFFRTGDGEYLINKKAARRKDVIALFMNTGVGKNGYSIIGQGKIDEIISSKSGDRRKVLEEAAGIAKYRSQRDETEKKLLQVVDNLFIAENTEKELSSRIGPLERDSEKAKKYLDIIGEKKQIDVSLSAYDISISKAEYDKYATQLITANRDLEFKKDSYEECSIKYERTFEDLQNHKRTIENDLDEINNLNKEIYEKETKAGIAISTNSFLTSQKEEAENKISELGIVCEQYKDKIKEEKVKLFQSNEKLLSYQNDLISIKEKDEKLCDEKQQEENNVSSIRERYENIRQSDVETQLELSANETKFESNEDRLKELEEQKEVVLSDIEANKVKISTSENRILLYTNKMNETKQILDSLEQTKTEKLDKKEDLINDKNNLNVEISSRYHKIENLEKMEELFEGYSKSVRFFMGEYKEGKINGTQDKVYGPVSNVIKVGEKYALALEIALGTQLQNIIVEDEDTAKASIYYLKENRGGRATFYPCSTMKGEPINEKVANPQNLKGYIDIACNLLKCDSKFKGILDYLLGRTIVVDNIDNATNISKSIGYKYKLVTLDGQVINAGGSYTGGSVNSEAGILSRKAMCDNIRDEIKTLSKDVLTIEKQICDLDLEIEKLNKSIKDNTTTYDLTKNLSIAEESNKNNIGETIVKEEETLSDIKNQISYIELLKDEDEASKDILLEKRKEYSDMLVGFEQSISNSIAHINELEQKIDQIREEYASKLRDNSSEEKANALIAQALNTYEENLNMNSNELEKYKEILKTTSNQIEENYSNSAEYRQDIENLQNKVEQLTKEKNILSEESITLEAKVNKINELQKGLQSDIELETRNVVTLENAKNNANEKYSKLIDFLWEEYEITYTSAVENSTIEITEDNRNEYYTRQTKLRNQLRALGSVNVNAIEEYKEVKTRYESLSKQTKDLRDSREEMLKAIKELEEQMKVDFADTIKAINENFNQVVYELFDGGKAEIVLGNEGDILNCDIDITVTLPGKKITSISLLSGGEKAFVAIALYFAMLKVNPTPFCILDEIEAALDEVNIDKFAQYVKNYANKTQFVIITHRRGTMRAADFIYGVTMHERGKSEVIPVTISEIEEKIGVELN